MASRCRVFIATSLDGFIARRNGSLDWLDEVNASVPPGEDCGYADFMGSVDLLVMGRGTFEKVLSFPEWPYGDKPVWVVSKSLTELPAHLPAAVRLQDLEPGALLALAQDHGLHELYVDGGRLIRSFLRDGLVSEMTITTVPVLLGSGLPLFADDARGKDIALRLTASRAYPFGFVQSTYAVEKA